MLVGIYMCQDYSCSSASYRAVMIVCEVTIVIKTLWIYHSFFPWSTCRGGGVIVNLSSISEVMVLPFLTTYSATKVDISVCSRIN